ncbi:putative rhodanese domain-containing dual specificity protein phosphatase [Termitomyces sp. J132]|nr:putative rhodanese domain-containing dual specificity protein phosphatase [Termitomyces sp. J132]
MFGFPDVNEIVEDQIYLGNIGAAQSPETLKKLGTTHILSVCPEYPSTGPNHFSIPIEDWEHENILIHLPATCQFIEPALSCNSKILVHCLMGMSRSATVVAAYLMKTRKMTRATAIKFIKQRRPEVHPNYGFIKQLEIFAECQYDPSPTHPTYCRWKQEQEQNITKHLNQIIDTTIIPDRLRLSIQFPEDIYQAESLILDAGITHLLSISPTRIPSDALKYLERHQHVEITNGKGGLLFALPDACLFIKEAIESDGQVLVHSRAETTAWIVVSAFMMIMYDLSVEEALTKLHDVWYHFSPTECFLRCLKLFKECGYNPTLNNPVIQKWMNSEFEAPSTFTPKSELQYGINGIAEHGEAISDSDFDKGAIEKIQAPITHKGTSSLSN